MYCFWYNNKNQPRIVVSPDYCYSLTQVAMTNFITFCFGILPMIYHAVYDGSSRLCTAGFLEHGIWADSAIESRLAAPRPPNS
jgi:hypothetical protein